eukprot:m.245107 g.245107  ORF g.245107 m.245107 type:complete len:95 (+) comp15358_c0_seq1:2827-3111(+)
MLSLGLIATNTLALFSFPCLFCLINNQSHIFFVSYVHVTFSFRVFAYGVHTHMHMRTHISLSTFSPFTHSTILRLALFPLVPSRDGERPVVCRH